MEKQISTISWWKRDFYLAAPIIIRFAQRWRAHSALVWMTHLLDSDSHDAVGSRCMNAGVRVTRGTNCLSYAASCRCVITLLHSNTYKPVVAMVTGSQETCARWLFFFFLASVKIWPWSLPVGGTGPFKGKTVAPMTCVSESLSKMNQNWLKQMIKKWKNEWPW